MAKNRYFSQNRFDSVALLKSQQGVSLLFLAGAIGILSIASLGLTDLMSYTARFQSSAMQKTDAAAISNAVDREMAKSSSSCTCSLSGTIYDITDPANIPDVAVAVINSTDSACAVIGEVVRTGSPVQLNPAFDTTAINLINNQIVEGSIMRSDLEVVLTSNGPNNIGAPDRRFLIPNLTVATNVIGTNATINGCTQQSRLPDTPLMIRPSGNDSGVLPTNLIFISAVNADPTVSTVLTFSDNVQRSRAGANFNHNVNTGLKDYVGADPVWSYLYAIPDPVTPSQWVTVLSENPPYNLPANPPGPNLPGDPAFKFLVALHRTAGVVDSFRKVGDTVHYTSPIVIPTTNGTGDQPSIITSVRFQPPPVPPSNDHLVPATAGGVILQVEIDGIIPEATTVRLYNDAGNISVGPPAAFPNPIGVFTSGTSTVARTFRSSDIYMGFWFPSAGFGRFTWEAVNAAGINRRIYVKGWKSSF